MSITALVSLAVFGQSTLNEVNLPSEIKTIYTVASPARITGQTIRLTGTKENPAVLALEGKGSIIQDCTFDLNGNAWVILYRADGAAAKGSTFRGGSATQLKIVRANDVLIEFNQFVGTGNSWALVEVTPGHPWQFTDAFRYGFDYVPESKYLGGTNRFQHTNFLDYERIASYDGGPQVKITYSNRVEPTFKPAFAKLNKFFVWGPDQVLHELPLVSASSTGFILKSDGAVPIGPIRYLTYNPEALMTGFVLRGNSFVGPGKSTGFSGYSLDGALIEKNRANGFTDYGIGVEFSTGTFLRANTASGNQPYIERASGLSKTWNQLEIVAPIGPSKVEGNTGVVADVRHWHPFAFSIDSDIPVRQQYPEGRTW